MSDLSDDYWRDYVHEVIKAAAYQRMFAPQQRSKSIKPVLECSEPWCEPSDTVFEEKKLTARVTTSPDVLDEL